MSIIKVQQQDKNGNVIYQETDSSLVKIDNTTLDSKITDIESRLDETFQSASNGKIAIASAITGKGVSASNSDTFDTLSNKINQIPSGVDTSDGNITASDMLSGKIGYSKDTKIIGTMPNNGALNSALALNGTYNIPAGYTSGGKITQSITTQAGSTTTPGTSDKTIVSANKYVTGNIIVKGDANLIASNILSGKSIFGVSGSASIASLGGYIKKVYTFSDGIKDQRNSYTVDTGIIPKLIYFKTGNYNPTDSGGLYDVETGIILSKEDYSTNFTVSGTTITIIFGWGGSLMTGTVVVFGK